MNVEKKMFVTDLDGTLFTDDKIIHSKDLEALEFLGKQGITRVFATGRSIYSFQKAITGLGFAPTGEDMPVDYVIFSTGAGIMECTHGKIIKKQCLASGDVQRIVEVFDSFCLAYMIHRPVPDTRYFVYKMAGSTTMSLPDFHARIALYHEFCRPMTKTDQTSFGESTEILAIVPPCRGHEVAGRVQQALGDFSVIKATSPLDGKSMWIEVFHPRVSKSQAVAWLCRRLGVDQNHVISVGNDYNDLDLLQWSGRGFVVANTPSDVQKGFVTVASNNQCGVAEAVFLMSSQFMVNKKGGFC